MERVYLTRPTLSFAAFEWGGGAVSNNISYE